ncbi:hypothetical protein LIER_38956 [Lithospermum erythrorhizon]|uniref:Uncharacterized protein n=1 Tax=Lithospermum erythrorhizon TaxID=34254 RepID=A0AAV3Q9Y2_LITER
MSPRSSYPMETSSLGYLKRCPSTSKERLCLKRMWRIIAKKRIGEKLKIDMGLNSDEEAEGSNDIEDEDSTEDVLGCDEDEDNDSEDAKTLEKDDDILNVPKSDKDVSKNDAEISRRGCKR